MRAIRILMLGMGVLLATVGSLRGPGAAAGNPAAVGQPAPEITGGPWINSQPLSLAGLRGRVVLVEFWTYG
jgi:hypothetical protein